jgi:hypothetical protein
LTEGSEFVPIAFVKYVLPAFLAVVCALTACKTTSDRFDLYSPDKPQGPYTAKLMAMNFPTRDVPEVPDTTGTSSQSSSDNTPPPPPPPPPRPGGGPPPPPRRSRAHANASGHAFRASRADDSRPCHARPGRSANARRHARHRRRLHTHNPRPEPVAGLLARRWRAQRATSLYRRDTGSPTQ